jgi:hypothetical protein
MPETNEGRWVWETSVGGESAERQARVGSYRYRSRPFSSPRNALCGAAGPSLGVIIHARLWAIFEAKLEWVKTGERVK